jgi:hypothetical protein
MILILASRHDDGARRAVAAWEADGARLLTAEDLSRPGWQYSPLQPGRSVAMVGSDRVTADEIEAVLIRLPAVVGDELPGIVSEDRDYVAAEMTAFLVAWLTSLECRVVNRPTPTCLMGPNWRPEQWSLAAAKAGMRVRPVRRLAAANLDQPTTESDAGAEVTLIGQHCFGAPTDALRAQIRRLGDAAGVDLLRVHLVDGAFAGADIWPDLEDPVLSECLRSYLTANPVRT